MTCAFAFPRHTTGRQQHRDQGLSEYRWRGEHGVVYKSARRDQGGVELRQRGVSGVDGDAPTKKSQYSVWRRPSQPICCTADPLLTCYGIVPASTCIGTGPTTCLRRPTTFDKYTPMLGHGQVIRKRARAHLTRHSPPQSWLSPTTSPRATRPRWPWSIPPRQRSTCSSPSMQQSGAVL